MKTLQAFQVLTIIENFGMNLYIFSALYANFFYTVALVIILQWHLDVEYSIGKGNLKIVPESIVYVLLKSIVHIWVHLLLQYFFFFQFYQSIATNPSPSTFTDASSVTYMDCSPPGSSVHGLFQARILEWVAISFFNSIFKRNVSLI